MIEAAGRSSVLRRPTVFSFLTLLAVTAATLVLACAPSSTTDSTPTPRPSQTIRLVNFNTDPAVQNVIRQLGSGEVAVSEIVFSDLTGDGADEAIVPITSGGTAGNIAYVVLTPKRGSPGETSVILTRRLERGSAGGLKLAVDTANGRPVLVETGAEYGAEDPFCCPTVLRRTTFRWDGSQLQVEREDKTNAPVNPKTRGE
jgi:hypothetical protein